MLGAFSSEQKLKQKWQGRVAKSLRYELNGDERYSYDV